MEDDQSKEYVISFLEKNGFKAKPILATSEYESPDLKIELDKGDLLVEVKSKTDDHQFRELLKSPKGTRLSKKPNYKRIFQKGWHQIQDFPERNNTEFTLIWFITHKFRFVTVLVEPTLFTLLYGIEDIEGYTVAQNKFYSTNCYFLMNHYSFVTKNSMVLYCMMRIIKRLLYV